MANKNELRLQEQVKGLEFRLSELESNLPHTVGTWSQSDLVQVRDEILDLCRRVAVLESASHKHGGNRGKAKAG